MKKAYEALEQEIDIVGMIRSKRFIHLALNYLLEKSVRERLQEQAKFEKIDIESPTQV